jgi:hypothetical protein
LANEKAFSGLAPESLMISWICLPWTPPFLFVSATSISRVLASGAPRNDAGPVTERIAPILIGSAAWVDAAHSKVASKVASMIPGTDPFFPVCFPRIFPSLLVCCSRSSIDSDPSPAHLVPPGVYPRFLTGANPHHSRVPVSG